MPPTTRPAAVVLLAGADAAAIASLQPAAEVLAGFGVGVQTAVVTEVGSSATSSDGTCAVIVASSDGVLPTALASATKLPVIRVPAATAEASGLRLLEDAAGSLPSAAGESVFATMAVGVAGAKNAALFVVAVLALDDERIRAAYSEFSCEPDRRRSEPSAVGTLAMDTVLLDAADPGAVQRAVGRLLAGELVALPTETVYGLAGDATRPEVAAAIFQAKDRPLFDPLIVHLPALDWLERLTRPADGSHSMLARLVERFWPGPLTLLLPRRPETVPDLVTSGSPLVAVRMSAHPVFRAVIETFGRPLAAPSANRFGRISPTTGAHVLTELAGRIPLILEAGSTTHGLESTVVFVGPDGALEILRHGPVTQETLAEFGPVRSRGAIASAESAPGQLPGHYAPRTPLEIVTPGTTLAPPSAARSVGLLAYRRDAKPAYVCGRVEFLTEDGDLREAAARFFAALRRLDESGMDVILAEAVPEAGLGRAIMERLRRAATGSGSRTSV